LAVSFDGLDVAAKFQFDGGQLVAQQRRYQQRVCQSFHHSADGKYVFPPPTTAIITIKFASEFSFPRLISARNEGKSSGALT
jgi:hypothetical protein